VEILTQYIMEEIIKEFYKNYVLIPFQIIYFLQLMEFFGF